MTNFKMTEDIRVHLYRAVFDKNPKSIKIVETALRLESLLKEVL